jgi:hypothetical protein
VVSIAELLSLAVFTRSVCASGAGHAFSIANMFVKSTIVRNEVVTGAFASFTSARRVLLESAGDSPMWNLGPPGDGS